MCRYTASKDKGGEVTIIDYSAPRNRDEPLESFQFPLVKQEVCGPCYQRNKVNCKRCDLLTTFYYTTDVIDEREGCHTWCRRCADANTTKWLSDGTRRTYAEPPQNRLIRPYHAAHDGGFKPIKSPWSASNATHRFVRYETSGELRYKGIGKKKQPDMRLEAKLEPLLFGCEIEVECPEDEPRTDFTGLVADSFLYELPDGTKGDLLASLEEDGSIEHGFEIITQPAGLDVHRAVWEKADLVGHRLRSHDTTTCGLHVHFTRAAVTPLTIAKLVDFVGDRKNRPFLERACRRTFNSYAVACKKRKFSSGFTRQQDMNRYDAMNTTNGKTIEFRLPRGSLRPPTVIATLELVYSMIRFCEASSVNNLSSDKFLDFLTTPGMMAETKKLRPYLVARGITDATRMKLPKLKPGEEPEPIMRPKQKEKEPTPPPPPAPEPALTYEGAVVQFGGVFDSTINRYIALGEAVAQFPTANRTHQPDYPFSLEPSVY